MYVWTVITETQSAVRRVSTFSLSSDEFDALGRRRHEDAGSCVPNYFARGLL